VNKASLSINNAGSLSIPLMLQPLKLINRQASTPRRALWRRSLKKQYKRTRSTENTWPEERAYMRLHSSCHHLDKAPLGHGLMYCRNSVIKIWMGSYFAQVQLIDNILSRKSGFVYMHLSNF